MFSISAVQAFVQVAEQRSFRRAGIQLGVSAAAVSKAIAGLEQQQGVTLFDRTSRSVVLTDAGVRLLPHLKHALDSLSAGAAALHETSNEVRGTLRVSLPFVLGGLFVQSLPGFLERFPEVTFDLRFTDRFVWLLEEDVDVALRIGELPDSSLLAKRLGRLDWLTVASPGYLKRHGTPKHPSQLRDHRCLKFRAPSGQIVEWVFAASASDPKRGRSLPLPSSHVFDQGERLVEAASADLGVAQVFGFLAHQPVRETALRAILTEFNVPGPPLHALAKPGQAKVGRVRALLDALPEMLGFGPSRRGGRGASRGKVPRDA